MIETLGYEGMSDEENDEEAAVPTLEVCILPWRRGIDEEMRTVDKAASEGDGQPRGSTGQPIDRIRNGKFGDRRVSMRPAFSGRPASFYESSYLKSLHSYERKRMGVKEGLDDTFIWP